MKCFYHSADLDGHCSGAIIKYKHSDCELWGINYGDDFPWESIKPFETVYMVDFSLQPFEDMVKLSENCRLIWVDHHKSAIEEAEKYDFNPYQKILIDGIGACASVWEHCFNGEMPQAVRLLAEYDVWNHKNPYTLPFQWGMRMEETYPDDTMDFWESIFDSFPVSIVNTGTIILAYEKQQNKKYCGACAFETTLDNLKCIAINRMLTNSQMFDSVWDNTKYDAMLTFGWRKGKWTVSLYTDKEHVDVSVAAKNRGGGGHKQAAGFQCSILPFMKLSKLDIK